MALFVLLAGTNLYGTDVDCLGKGSGGSTVGDCPGLCRPVCPSLRHVDTPAAGKDSADGTPAKRRVLDLWWDAIVAEGSSTRASGASEGPRVAIATNATYLKSVERWAMSKRIPTARIVNTGLAGVSTGLAEVVSCIARDAMLATAADDARPATDGPSAGAGSGAGAGTGAGGGGGAGSATAVGPVVVLAVDSLPPPSLVSSLVKRLVAAAVAGQSTVVVAGSDVPLASAKPRCSVHVNDGGRVVGSCVVGDQQAAGALGALIRVASAKAAPAVGSHGRPAPAAYALSADDAAAVASLSSVPARAACAVEALVPVLQSAGRPLMAMDLDDSDEAVTYLFGGNTAASCGGTLAEVEAVLPPVASGASVWPPVDVPVPAGAIHAHAYARVGMMGNPSDGFNGKTVGTTIGNYWADAWIWPSDSVHLVPHALYDAQTFCNLDQLDGSIGKDGYPGGRRLLAATLRRFVHQCRAAGVELPARGFTLKYDTNVPRQVGLAGSSAIITAVFRCLLRFFGFDSDPTRIGLPLELQPSFVLSVEDSELGVKAGLQDRVLQVYQGAVFMDFNAGVAAGKQHGIYERLPTSMLPRMFLAYAQEASDSGRIHAPVRERFAAGDPETVKGMREIAELAQATRDAMVGGTATAAIVGPLMSANFALRRKLYGDASIGATNVRLVTIAEDVGAYAKFPGSGGAAIGVLDPVRVLKRAGADVGDVAACTWERGFQVLRAAYMTHGFVAVELQPVT